MLFHTLPFLLFMLVVLPVFFALRKTPFWIPWLLAASYFFYGWWNPYYLLLIAYSTTLDYLLVTLMDHCPPPGGTGGGPRDTTLRAALIVSSALALCLIVGAVSGPPSLRPTLIAFAALVSLMSLGSFLASRRVWLLISLVNNLFLLLF